jgi:8-oxo-dGTP pyrophosphatase MutT (NUDIX family)
VSGTIAAPRRVARVVLLDPDDRILLLHGFEPADPSLTWWFTPGGGAEPGESLPDAARRELREETGITEVELGPVIWRRRSTFSFAGQRWANDEWYLLGHTRETDVDMSGRTELELASTTGARWWTLQELRAVADEAREADEAGGPGGAGDAGGCRRSRGGRVQAGGSADPGRWAGSRRPSRFPQELRRHRTGERFFPAELAQMLGTLLESGPPAVPLVLDSQDD